MKTTALGLTVILMVAACAWVYMILVGILHHDWWSRIPPMGYPTALVISAVLFGWILLCVIVQVFIKEWND